MLLWQAYRNLVKAIAQACPHTLHSRSILCRSTMTSCLTRFPFTFPMKAPNSRVSDDLQGGEPMQHLMCAAYIHQRGNHPPGNCTLRPQIYRHVQSIKSTCMYLTAGATLPQHSAVCTAWVYRFRQHFQKLAFVSLRREYS